MSRFSDWMPRGVVPAVHLPLVKLPPHEIERLCRVIAASGLDRDGSTPIIAPLAAE